MTHGYGRKQTKVIHQTGSLPPCIPYKSYTLTPKKMKSKFLPYFGALLFLLSILFVWRMFTEGYRSGHPSLNEAAIKPDIYLSNAKHYTKESLAIRSLAHLDKAITAIELIESDIDINSREQVEKAVEGLELIYQEILKDSLVSDDLNEAFEQTLYALTLAELRVSERYAESNKPAMAKVALKYAQMHLKSASQYAELPNLEKERHIYNEIDSLIRSEAMAPVLIAEKIDHMIMEMDTLVGK